MNLITVQQLNFHYHHRHIFKGLNFTVAPEDFLCIVGPNGSGKTTLLKLLLGELQPSSGHITFDTSIQPNFIGYMPQENRIDRNFPATAQEIIATGTLNRGLIQSRKAKATVAQNLKLLKLTSLAQHNFAELSGGQRQKVLLARALTATQKLLILDEASNNLDYTSKQSFYQLLQQLHDQQKLTILMVTHDLDHHNLLGNKILSLDPANPFFGSTADYVRRLHAH